MLRSFDNLALLKEIKELQGAAFADKLQRDFADKIVVFNHVSFIPRDLLSEDLQTKVTNLDNYFLLGYLCKEFGIHKTTFRKRIKLMKTQGVKYFNYKQICNLYFIKVDDEQKRLLQSYEGATASLKYLVSQSDEKWMKGIVLLGDISIVLY